MLDFYLIKDDQTKPNSPEQIGLVFAGSLDDKTFNNLVKKNVLDTRFDYYLDFRIGIDLVKQIQQTILQRKLETDSDVIKLLDLLDKADNSSSGLIAFGD